MNSAAFPGWSAGAQPEEREFADDTTVFLCGEFTAMLKLLFTEDTPEWREFCETTPTGIPDDLASGQAESEQS